MKHWNIMAIFLLVGGTFCVSAQDMIVFKDGNMIEAKVVEISPSEIRYKRFDHLDGPTIVIPAVNVLSIRYENGNYEIINAAPTASQGTAQTERPRTAATNQTTAIDPDRFIFGINANAGGAIGYAYSGAYGAGINIELGKGRFNSEINFMFPRGGFGILATFNGFWPSRIGGFYLGGGIGFSVYETYGNVDRDDYYGGSYYDAGWVTALAFPLGLNIGYKFVTKSGVYFRTGAFIALDFASLSNDFGSPVYFKPDLAIGWTMR